jgi:hypothetical protein
MLLLTMPRRFIAALCIARLASAAWSDGDVGIDHMGNDIK